jgi:hypothetical protein
MGFMNVCEVTHTLYSGGTPQIVERFSGCKRRLSESCWVLEVVTHVEMFFI